MKPIKSERTKLLGFVFFFFGGNLHTRFNFKNLTKTEA